MEQKQLDSGWIRLSVVGTNAWAQIPPGFCDAGIPDKFIFDPEWNRERVNVAWRCERRNND